MHEATKLTLTAHALGVLKGRLEARSLASISPALMASDPGLAKALTREEDGQPTPVASRLPTADAAAGPAEGEEGDGEGGGPKEEVVDCAFYFLDAALLRESCPEELPRLPSYRELRRKSPGWLVERTLTVDEACDGGVSGSSAGGASSRARTVLAVSHRWEEDDAPDPSGAQLDAIRKHLLEHPEIEHVWYDYSCMPPAASVDDDAHHRRGLTAEERAARDRMRHCACLPFLCASCLLLVDAGFTARFWTQYEAWLSLQLATATGLVDPSSRSRCTIVLMHREPDFMATLLAEMWATKSVAQACEVLRAPLVPTGRPEDKEEQLSKLERLHEWLRVEGPRKVPTLMREEVADDMSDAPKIV